MRTNNNWTTKRKTILAKDDEVTLSSKHSHGALKSQDKDALTSVCGVCTPNESLKTAHEKTKMLATKFSTSVLAIKANKIIIC